MATPFGLGPNSFSVASLSLIRNTVNSNSVAIVTLILIGLLIAGGEFLYYNGSFGNTRRIRRVVCLSAVKAVLKQYECVRHYVFDLSVGLAVNFALTAVQGNVDPQFSQWVGTGVGKPMAKTPSAATGYFASHISLKSSRA